MKKILVILTLIISILPVFSDAVWEEIPSKNKTIYIDTSSIIQQGSEYLYWIKVNNQNGYSQILMKSDCSKNLTGAQKLVTYDNKGNMIKSKDINQELSYVVSDSNAQAAYNYVANMYKEQQAKEYRRQNAITPTKILNSVNSINNAGYEIRSIKSNALNVLKGF